MDILIPIGSFISVLGVVGLGYCIFQAFKAKNAGLSNEDLTARLQKLVAVNMGALFLSSIGLMMVVMGILL